MNCLKRNELNVIVFVAENADDNGIARVKIDTLEKISKLNNDLLKGLLLKLKSLVLNVNVNGKVIYTTVFNSIRYDNDFLEIGVSVSILDILLERDNFIVNIEGIDLLRLKRAILLYKYLYDNNFRSMSFYLKDLKELLSSNMDSYGLFKIRDLMPAVREINKKTDCEVRVQEIKEKGSKKVIGITLIINK